MKRKLLLCVSFAAILTLTACNLNLDPVGNISSSSSSSETSSDKSSGGKSSSSGSSSSSSSSSFSSSSSSDGGEDEDITIKSSATYKTYFAKESYISSTLYMTNQYADIPYVKFMDAYQKLYNEALYGGKDYYFGLTKTNKGNHVFDFDNRLGKFTIDTANDLFSAPNPMQNYSRLGTTDSGVSYIADGYETGYVTINESETIDLSPRQTINLNLSQYSINLFDLDGDVYMPLITFVDIFYTGNGLSLSFNGKDLYFTSALEDNKYGENVQSDSLEYKYYTESPWDEKATRSASLATFTYNEMCFALDNFYGLAEVRGVTSFDTFFSSNGYKNDLLSTNTDTYEKGMVRFVAKWLYEGHSGYTKVSPFKRGTNYGSYYSSYIGSNTKYKKLFPTQDELTAKRNAAGKAQGVSFSGKTAIISFDSFMKSSNTKNVNVDDYSYADFAEADNYLFFKKAFKDIATHGGIENIVVDVTLNGGGMVDSLPWLYAFMSDDPVIAMKHTVTKEVSEVHYNVDLNQNGTYGDTGDTYKGKYNFYIMTSNFSFSCGNAFPTFAKQYGYAKIIGETSGGGACAVGAYSSACGTIFRFSSPYQFGSWNDGWTSNENGVTPDYTFNRNNFYNDAAIDEFVTSLS